MGIFEDRVREIDKSGMLELILSMPEEWERAVVDYEAVQLPDKPPYVRPRRIIVIGMGGSAIGGDIVYDYLYERLTVPYTVCRDFLAPRWVDKNTLVIAVSYSGNTEETIRCLRDVLNRGAGAVLVTSDGILEKLGRKRGLPLLKLPQGRPPRTAVTYMVASILWVLDKAEVVEFPRAEAAEAATALRDARKDVLKEDSEELKLAKALEGRIPLIYSYRPYLSVGLRFKTQINENAKSHAFWCPLPEGNHNEIMGWEGALSAPLAPVLIRGKEEPEYLRVRIEFWRTMLSSRGVPFYEVVSNKGCRLSELLTLLLKLDMVSYLLAIVKGVDPTPVTTITGLKRYVSERIKFEEQVREWF